jgi:hypothetical protein
VPSYLAPPIETDPDILAEECFNFLQTEYPGWLPNEGNFEVWLIEALSRLIAELRDITSLVPTAIFKYFGMTLMGIVPIEATPATGYTTWTMVDDSGYTIPAGTQVVMLDNAGNEHPFVTSVDVIVPTGNTVTDTGGVLITAVFEGVDGSGLSGTVDTLDVLAFVQSVVVEGQTTGGQDAQTDDEYLDHLVEQLQLMAPRPILPADFAAMAKNIAGVFRAYAYDGLVPSVNEVQQIAVDATAGTFTVTFGAGTTAALAFNISPAALSTALQGLSTIGSGNVVVTGGPGGAGGTTPYLITFVGARGATNQAAMTTNATLLTGSAHTATVTTVKNGSPTAYNTERYTTVFPVDEFGQPISAGLKATLSAYMESLREVNFVVPIADPTYTQIDVQVELTANPGTDKVALQSAVISSLQNYLNPALWGVPFSDLTEWVNDTKLRFLEVAQVVNNVFGVRYIVSMTTAIHNGSPNVTDIQMLGDVALPTAGSIVVTVD